MIQKKIIEEYRRLNSEDRSTIQSWLRAYAVVGAIMLFALIARVLVYSGDGSNMAMDQKETVTYVDSR